MNKLDFSDLLQAFSHWTYVVTSSNMIVVDLQGVERDDEFILTDPSIHSDQFEFGNTNLGQEGIHRFFKTHNCGNICKALNLK